MRNFGQARVLSALLLAVPLSAAAQPAEPQERPRPKTRRSSRKR